MSADKNSVKTKICIIISRFNKPVTDNLLEGARAAFRNNELDESCIDIYYVPGAFEIPVVLKKIARENIDRKKYDGILTIGCVIKGETAHFEYISESVTSGISKISYEYEIPTGFCVLTCYDSRQAIERSLLPPDADNNKGYEAALSLLEMINLLKNI